MDRGITLAGGGALLQVPEQRLRDECQMPRQLAESSLTCATVGSSISREEVETIRRAGKNNRAQSWIRPLLMRTPQLRSPTCIESKYAAAGRCSRC
jgi:hypothetical protein